MERTLIVVEQIEESKALILRGSSAHLRMALILLDNAAELLMHRAVEGILFRNILDERLLLTFRNAVAEGYEDGAAHVRELEERVISNSRKQQVRLKFPAKLKLLVERAGLPSPLA